MYNNRLSAARMHAVSAGTWVLGFAMGMLSFIWAKDGGGSQAVNTCFITIMPFPYWVGLINWPFIAISASILVMYVRIIRIASRHLHHYGSRRRRWLAATAARRLSAASGAPLPVPSVARQQSAANVDCSNSLDVAVIDVGTTRYDFAGLQEKLELASSMGGDDRTASESEMTKVAVLPVQHLDQPLTQQAANQKSSTMCDISSDGESDSNRNYCEFNRNNDVSDNKNGVFAMIRESKFMTGDNCSEIIANRIDNGDTATNNNGIYSILLNGENGGSLTHQSNKLALGLGSIHATNSKSRDLSTDDYVICNEPAIRNDLSKSPTTAVTVTCGGSYTAVLPTKQLGLPIRKRETNNLNVCLAPSAYDSRRTTDGDASATRTQTNASTPAVVEADLDSHYSMGSMVTDGGVGGEVAGRGGATSLRNDEARRRRLRVHHNHELQLIVTMLVTYLTFVICWLPLEFAVYCTSLGLIEDASQSPFVEFSLALSLTNSGVNVIIYSWRYVAFRKAIRNLFVRKPQTSNGATATEARSGFRQASSCRVYA